MKSPPAQVLPVTIISPTHGVGVAMVISQAFLAVLLLMGIGSTDALSHLLTQQWAAVLVPILILLSACGALLGIWSVTRVCRYDSSGLLQASLRLELACKAVLTVTTLLYAYALTWYYGLYEAPNISVYVWFTGGGFAVRVVQIVRDLRAITRAHREGLAANPPPLGRTGQE